MTLDELITKLNDIREKHGGYLRVAIKRGDRYYDFEILVLKCYSEPRVVSDSYDYDMPVIEYIRVPDRIVFWPHQYPINYEEEE
jgi:hypothetical protein